MSGSSRAPLSTVGRAAEAAYNPNRSICPSAGDHRIVAAELKFDIRRRAVNLSR
jgi:hypothetical protein